MAIFEVQSPDGSVYQIEAPDQNTAMAGFQKFSAGQAAKPSTADTAARFAVKGLTFGLSDESYGLTQGIKGLFTGDGFVKGYDQGVQEYRARDKAAKEANPITATAAEIAGGMGTGLGAAKAGLTLMKAGMTLPELIGAGIVEGGGYGAIHGAGNAEGGAPERLQGASEGARSGALVGGGVPVAARGVGATINTMLTPMATPPGRQAAVDSLTREGVPLTAGQRSGSKALQYGESFFGDAPLAGGRATRAMEAQGEAFTDAAMRKAGASGRATPENIQASVDRIGKEFTDLSARNTMQADRQLGSDLGNVLTRYDRLLEPQQKQILGTIATDLVDRIKAGNGTLPGAEYQATRSWLSTASQNEGNKHLAGALKGMRDALDNSMIRSLSPEDAAAWQSARRQHGNIKDIADAAAGNGENAAAGLITPQALRQAAATGKNREAYARGQGDFVELTRAGNQVMAPLPNAGIAQRGLSLGQAGALLGGSTGMTDLLWAGIAALGPAAAGRIIMSPMAQAYFGNKAMSPSARAAIEGQLRAMIEGGAQTQSPRLREP
ncbi:hypothetical protein [Bosea sp. 685]|uniref:hypothetical protein n=1 Tax=Bosea sp. 685 TaxID=3080057 RepID=UPI002892F3F9|nr:hypothetical protein [Bosea sp. 685]WNJ88461.1 hypothetical protein RMR04_18825 [Bosea sp. 685]